MKKKLFSLLAVIALLISNVSVFGSEQEILLIDNNLDNYLDNNSNYVLQRDGCIYEYDRTTNDNFVNLWEDRIENNCISYEYYTVNQETVKEALDANDWREDKPDCEIYVVIEDYQETNNNVPSEPTAVPTEEPTNTPAEPTAVPTEVPANTPAEPTAVPTEEPTNTPAEPTAVPTEEPTNTPAEPTQTPETEPTAVPTEEPTNTPAEPTAVPTEVPTLVPTAVPAQVTSFPTSTPIPVDVPKTETQLVARPVEKTPTYVEYNIAVEVGRRVHIDPILDTHTVLSSSDETVLSTPYRRYADDYPSMAYKPGQATLTFYNQKENHTEVWNVTVYTRALDFEQQEYVVEKTGNDYQYAYLSMENFTHTFEPSYYFEWSSSNGEVAEIYGVDSFCTYARVRINKKGATIITVKDSFGNRASCVLIVKNSPKYEVKASNVALKGTVKKGCITYKWSVDSETEFEGYELAISGDLGKNYTFKKVITKVSKLSYKYKNGKKNKIYYAKVRAYKTINGKKVYTSWSKVFACTFKK